MDEEMKKALEKFFANLTDEQKEKVKECKTMEELMDFAGKEGLELPDELLDGVAGGGSSYYPDSIPGLFPEATFANYISEHPISEHPNEAGKINEFLREFDPTIYIENFRNK